MSSPCEQNFKRTTVVTPNGREFTYERVNLVTEPGCWMGWMGWGSGGMASTLTWADDEGAYAEEAEAEEAEAEEAEEAEAEEAKNGADSAK